VIAPSDPSPEQPAQLHSEGVHEPNVVQLGRLDSAPQPYSRSAYKEYMYRTLVMASRGGTNADDLSPETSLLREERIP
jgi:hypothetical protein